MTSTMQHELQALRAAAESYGARHVHLEHFAYPPGIRMAVNLTVDFDAMLLRRVSNEPPMQLAKGEFGGRVGMTATFAVPAVIADIYPATVRAILEHGHEVAAHGFKHEDVSQLDKDQERERLEAATASLTRVTGQRPAGWYSLPRQRDPFAVGTISPHTIDLLLDAGYQYMGNGLADDIPYYWVTDMQTLRPLLTLPYYYHFDDQFFLMFPPPGLGS